MIKLLDSIGYDKTKSMSTFINPTGLLIDIKGYSIVSPQVYDGGEFKFYVYDSSILSNNTIDIRMFVGNILIILHNEFADKPKTA